MIFVGDPVVASDISGVFIGNVKLFELSNKKLNSILLDNLLDEKSDGQLFWSGAYDGLSPFWFKSHTNQT